MNGYVVAGLCLAAVLNIFYVWATVQQRRPPDMARIVHLVLSSTGALAGVRIIVLSVAERDLGPFTDEDRVYLVLGGIALIVASMQNLLAVVAAVYPGKEQERLSETP